MKAMDTNGNGMLDYTEFIAGCMQSYVYCKESNLKTAFEYFDKDKSGNISKDELLQCMQDEDLTITEEEIDRMIKEVDIDGDGEINYKEFLEMMKSNSSLLNGGGGDQQ